jgi:AbrB family looped-hinge helix DNA binding protein
MATLRQSKITRKGQVTIPIEIREKFDFKEGDTVLFEERGKHVVILHPEDVEDWTAGAFREYTKGEFLTPDEIKEIAAQSIADQVMSEMEEIDR